MKRHENKTEQVQVPADVTVNRTTLHAGTYWVRMPNRYRAEDVTGADVLADPALWVVGQGELRDWVVIFDHQGEQGADWDSAQGASQWPAKVWGVVQAPEPDAAVRVVQCEGLPVGDWWTEDADLHVIPPDR